MSVHAAGIHQADQTAGLAQEMLDKMTPEERVGQLFLVGFNGSNAGEQSQIYTLITRYHVGGTILDASNDNFVAAPDTIPAAYTLISQLQNAAYQASLSLPVNTPEAGTPTPLPEPTTIPANYIPLVVGISQNGDGYPNDQILSGLTSLPDLMAIGATWDPALAEKVGAVAGQELSSLGFNLFLGPSLDVLETPASTLLNGLNANVFGGDPYWVGVMGSAYITGLHKGSNNRILVIADHFPGRGSADRPPGEEPATVRKSLEQLKQIELAPFIAVTGTAQTPQSTVDGLLVSHIRYQGFQGNIRSTTQPVSLDHQSLSQILSLPSFSSWYAAGGLIVSDDLGSQTVRLFYDPGGSSFQSRQVALDAFLAGNDMLNMGNIISTDTKDNFESVVQAIDFFSQKYLGDPAFAKRVDDTVLRILSAKYRLFGSFDSEKVMPGESGLSQLASFEDVSFEVARRASTLISPDKSDLETVLPSPPELPDHIVFITDTRTGKQCSTCNDEQMLAVDSLQNVIKRLYGSQAGGQVLSGRLISFSLDSIAGILQGGAGNQDLETSLNQSNWVVISMLDAEPGQAQTILLRRFLSERQDLLRDKHVIVFAFNAPFFLDSTDISKLTAYYCLYSKSSPFIEVAARLLFRELSPNGTLPVSVAGIGYDLLSATAPDPNQVVELTLDVVPQPTPTAGNQTSEEPTPTSSFRVGDTFTVRTGTIVDHNGHAVPDGTGVRFRMTMSGSGGFVQQMDSATVDGIARASFNIDRPGLLEISATSEPAITSVVLQLNVTSEGSSVTVVTPTPIPEFTPTPTQIIPTPTMEPVPPIEQGHFGFPGWLLMTLLLSVYGFLAYWLGNRLAGSSWGLRWALGVVMGGLLAYTYMAIRLPGTLAFLNLSGLSGLMGLVLLGGTAGFGSAYGWFRMTRSKKRSN
jgi:beta-N-acetylhexosaminidase